MIIKGTYPKFEVTCEPDDIYSFSNYGDSLGKEHEFVKNSPITFDMERAGVEKEANHIELIAMSLGIKDECVRLEENG